MLRAIFAQAMVKTFPKNKMLIAEGDRTTDSIYLIQSGKVKVFLCSADGKEVDLYVLEPGDYFGEMEIDAGPRSASVVTIEPSQLIVIRQIELAKRSTFRSVTSMNDRPVLAVGIYVSASIALLMFMLPQSGAIEHGPIGSVGSAIDALPPSGAGRSMSPTQAAPMVPPPEGYLGGTKATGRVAEVYVKVANNVFLAVNQASEHLPKDAERWVDIEFPDLLAYDIGSARAVLNQSEAGVRVGDVVEIKFAHKDNPRYFPVNEVTRVTEFVARKDEMLAKEFERRILARNGHGASPPDWLAHAQTLPSSRSPAPRTTTADARP